ncbi:F-actin-capping protein subunit alpha [Podospora pseudopauciseta]|uniref:F-actin-capping protein subunit alpha n=1 Tax=Podospora pseudopauciseta TaxID=2093780 RepID=A0ABR0HCU5_9PEZI|nr:F-actin-capping protein subunit alpha [Podospora pseudopauciseta]
MSSNTAIISSFVEGAPPGEACLFFCTPLLLQPVPELPILPKRATPSSALDLHPCWSRTTRLTVRVDIKAITGPDPNLIKNLSPAFQKYNEEQFITAKLPGGSSQVIISEFSALGEGRYFDSESQSSFEFDHSTGKAANVQSHVLEGEQASLVKSTLSTVGTYVKEHYPNAAYGAYPIENDTKVAVVIVANKYSPHNFWNGRWRSFYIYDPSSNSLEGSIKVDVHYYEDGNVRLLTDKKVSASVSAGRAADGIAREISTAEKKYQEDLNRSFTQLSEGAFKALRRQLPVTRQKIEWDKVASYRLGQDIGGGSVRR